MSLSLMRCPTSPPSNGASSISRAPTNGNIARLRVLDSLTSPMAALLSCYRKVHLRNQSRESLQSGVTYASMESEYCRYLKTGGMGGGLDKVIKAQLPCAFLSLLDVGLFKLSCLHTGTRAFSYFPATSEGGAKGNLWNKRVHMMLETEEELKPWISNGSQHLLTTKFRDWSIKGL